MPVGNTVPAEETRRGRHAHRASNSRPSWLKQHTGLALSAVALGSVIAVSAVNAVATISSPASDVAAFATAESTLTGLGTPGQEDNEAATDEEVAIMAAAELLTVSEAVGEQSPEVIAAKEDLEELLVAFADVEIAPAEVADLPERGRAASRDQGRAELESAEQETQDLELAEDKLTDQGSATEKARSESEKLEEPEDRDATLPAAEEPESAALSSESEVVTLTDIEQAIQTLEGLLEGQTVTSVTTAQEIKDLDMVQSWDLADTLALSTAGYSNGNIPRSALADLSFAPGHVLRADAAMMLELLNIEFRANFGHDIRMTDSYRSYSLQVTTKANKGYLAATPGTSNHGLGLAVDLRDAVAHWGSAERNWLVVHGPEYGWISPGWAQRGNGKEEPWHWEFAGRSVSQR